MPWAVAAAVVGAAGSAYASDKAADAQVGAANKARNLTQRQFEQTRSDFQPYRTVGDQALGKISRTLGLGGGAPDMSEFEADPGYQFRLSEGNQALDRSAAGRGMLLSGAQLKASQRYNQGMASQEFGNFFNRLYGLSQMGQNAAAQVGSFGAQSAANQGNYLMDAGNARAQGYQNVNNAITSGVNDIATMYGKRSSGYAQPQQQIQPYTGPKPLYDYGP